MERENTWEGGRGSENREAPRLKEKEKIEQNLANLANGKNQDDMITKQTRKKVTWIYWSGSDNDDKKGQENEI